MFTMRGSITKGYANGDDVAVVTQALRALGYYHHPDKNLDPLADGDFYAALQKFQTAQGLDPTGEMDRMDPTHRRMKDALQKNAIKRDLFGRYRGDYEHRQDLVAWGEDTGGEAVAERPGSPVGRPG
jgi:hypothetical protein